MGSALSFIIVFRTNASYDRWWEARCAWQQISTTCRMLAAQTAPSLRHADANRELSMQLLAFVLALKTDLRDAGGITEEE